MGTYVRTRGGGKRNCPRLTVAAAGLRSVSGSVVDFGQAACAVWIVGLEAGQLTYSGYYDIALRDFGLMLGALTLARLASVYDPPGLEVSL